MVLEEQYGAPADATSSEIFKIDRLLPGEPSEHSDEVNISEGECSCNNG